jgi:hypothetical protein
MSGRRWLWCFGAACLVASLACGDYTAPTSPSHKTAPTRASHSRYILISGVWTCVEDCDDTGGEPNPGIEGLPFILDSLTFQTLPIDGSLPSIPVETIAPSDSPSNDP